MLPLSILEGDLDDLAEPARLLCDERISFSCPLRTLTCAEVRELLDLGAIRLVDAAGDLERDGSVDDVMRAVAGRLVASGGREVSTEAVEAEAAVTADGLSAAEQQDLPLFRLVLEETVAATGLTSSWLMSSATSVTDRALHRGLYTSFLSLSVCTLLAFSAVSPFSCPIRTKWFLRCSTDLSLPRRRTSPLHLTESTSLGR